MSHQIPVFRNGADVGISGLAPGDLIAIETTHLIPMGPGLCEAIPAYSLFSFKELRGSLGQLFIWGRGYHFCGEEPNYIPNEVLGINANCVRRIVIIDDSHPLSQLAHVFFGLWEENRKLAGENARLVAENAQLIASHFRSNPERIQ